MRGRMAVEVKRAMQRLPKGAEACRAASGGRSNEADEMERRLRSHLFPWERGVLGRTDEEAAGRKLRWWEKAYWAALFIAVGGLVGRKVHEKYVREPREQERRRREREEAITRAKAQRAMEAGSFLEEDAFEGLSPGEIEQEVRRRAGPSGDPFEGMSPEEINEEVRRAPRRP